MVVEEFYQRVVEVGTSGCIALKVKRIEIRVDIRH
jgi:hypothetical protein